MVSPLESKGWICVYSLNKLKPMVKYYKYNFLLYKCFIFVKFWCNSACSDFSLFFKQRSELASVFQWQHSGDMPHNESTFLLNLLEWHWLIKLYKFQVYNSIVHHLYIALCVHHTKSSPLPSLSPRIRPWPSSVSPTPFPSRNQSPLCALGMSFCSFFLLHPFALFSQSLKLLPC